MNSTSAAPLFLQFDFTRPPGFASPCRFVDPVKVVCAWRIEEVLPSLRRVQEAVDRGLFAAGFVSYEAAFAFDPAMRTPPQGDLPLVWFGLYTGPSPIEEDTLAAEPVAEVEWTSPGDESRFRAEIAAIRASIAAGDVYQVNHTQRLCAKFTGDAFAWYRQLRPAQGAAYSAYLDIGAFQILSLSPELFFRTLPELDEARVCQYSNSLRQPGNTDQPSFPSSSSSPSCQNESTSARTITTCPMKGTHKRGRWAEEDIAFQHELRSSEKERAENLMIVDLLRNDLGRIAQTGTVAVDELFRVERYPTLFQMTSAISARLRDGAGLPEIFAALFPCGSVTGAPKIAAMRRIADLEPDPRGVYCGAIGYLQPGGRAVFSVAIRTLTVNKETNVAKYGVGSGITWDSEAEAEAAENRLKAAVLSAPPDRPDLFETLRLRDGTYTRVERHLARILASAEYFDIPANPVRLRDALAQRAATQSSGLWRVRLLLSAAGAVATECVPLEDPPDAPRTFALASLPVDRSDRRLFHKVVDRSLYAVRRAGCPDTDDVLMQNGQGEITEFTTGNLVLEIGGKQLTPPLDCGLLPGVLRAEGLEAGGIEERVLTPADLAKAERIWLINSLRGWVPMHFTPSDSLS